MRKSLALSLGLLFLLSCQPYLDHPVDDGFPTALAPHGLRRRLALSRLEGTPRSLLMVFNQPLRTLDSKTEPPFRPLLLPELPIAEVAYEGVAGVRVSFESEVPANSHSHLLRIPAGWRALTGALLSQPLEKRWQVRSAPAPLPTSPSPFPLPSLTPPKAPDSAASGTLWLPRTWVAQAQPVIVVGRAHPGSSARRGELSLRSDQGARLWSSTLSWAEGRPFVARVPAPQAEGRYRLEFVPQGEAGSWEGEFSVCPTVEPGERYEIEIATQESGASPSEAVLQRHGPRHRAVGLRAYLTPTESSSGSALGEAVEGSRIPLHQTDQERLSLEGSTVPFAGVLAVEAFDRAEPDLILARWQQPVAQSATPTPERVALELQRWDGVRAELSAGEFGRLSGPGGAVAGWVPVLPGWESATGSGADPGGRPLLGQSDIASHETAGWLLDSQGELGLPAPSVAGRYRFWWVDSSGDSGETEIEIGERTRWKTRAPRGVRAGDRFRAGPTFVPGPLTAPVGLTASVLPSDVTPTGYFSTAGLAKGSEQSLLFDYQAPLGRTEPMSLRWQVGYGGYAQQLATEVALWPTLAASRQPLSAGLGSRQTDARAAERGAAEAWAGRVYLARSARDGANRPVQRWVEKDGMKVLLSLLIPAGELSGRLECPLPAGVEPLEVRAANSPTPTVCWSYEQGILQWETRDLTPGEYLWEVELEPRCAGEFLWPSARFVSPKGELWARSGSSRLTLEP